MKQLVFMLPYVLLEVVFVGCGPRHEVGTPSPNNSAVLSTEGDKFVLDQPPVGAKGVVSVRANAIDDDEVVITGRIGGGVNPWNKGRAAFSIVDPELNACNQIPGDACPTPWDYCCETSKLPTSTALIKIVKKDGSLVKIDARQLLGLKELQTVIVAGKAQVDSVGNLTVLADGVFVRNDQ